MKFHIISVLLLATNTSAFILPTIPAAFTASKTHVVTTNLAAIIHPDYDDNTSDHTNIINKQKQSKPILSSNKNLLLLTPRDARLLLPLSSLLTTTTTTLLTTPSITHADDTTSTSTSSSSSFDETLKTYFPGALTSGVITLRVMSTLRKRDYRPYNTLMGTIIDDADEIIDTPQSLMTLLRKQLCETKDGGVAHLGGFGGLPFGLGAGGGWEVLKSHCPKSGGEGKMFIMFGPNVGISESGEVGKVERVGSDASATDCGAAVKIYDLLAGGGGGGGSTTAMGGGFDVEQKFVMDKLKFSTSTDKKKGRDETIVEITKQLYAVGLDTITQQLASVTSKREFWKNDDVKELTLMGGIIINRGHGSGTKGGQDYFQPLLMTTYTKGGEVNLYGEVFGDLPTPVGANS